MCVTCQLTFTPGLLLFINLWTYLLQLEYIIIIKVLCHGYFSSNVLMSAHLLNELPVLVLKLVKLYLLSACCIYLATNQKVPKTSWFYISYIPYKQSSYIYFPKFKLISLMVKIWRLIRRTIQIVYKCLNMILWKQSDYRLVYLSEYCTHLRLFQDGNVEMEFIFFQVSRSAGRQTLIFTSNKW